MESGTRDSNKRLRKKFTKYELYDVTRKPKEWMTDNKTFMRDLQKLNIHIDDSNMMTQILLNLPEESKNIVEILEEELDNKDKLLII